MVDKKLVNRGSMSLNCSFCGNRFVSVLLTKEDRIAESTKLLLTHWERNHKNEMVEIAKGLATSIQAYQWYLLISMYANIPNQSEELLQEKENGLDIIMKSLGYDDDEDVEDDELEDSEEEEEEDDEIDLPEPEDTESLILTPSEPIAVRTES